MSYRERLRTPAAFLPWLMSFGLLVSVGRFAVAEDHSIGMKTESGWYVHDGRVIWGYAQHNGWWRVGQRPNIARNAPDEVGPNRTEDLDKLTDAMLRFGYPGFEHNFGLWYDRRRDAHDQTRRNDDRVVPPFLEQPWARSAKGRAWDGLTKHDHQPSQDNPRLLPHLRIGLRQAGEKSGLVASRSLGVSARMTSCQS